MAGFRTTAAGGRRHVVTLGAFVGLTGLIVWLSGCPTAAPPVHDPCDELDCGVNSACVDGVCVDLCETDADCGDGDACTTDTCDGGICIRDAVACDGDAVCDPGTGDCVAAECTEDADCDDGDACTADTCAGGLCMVTTTGCNGLACDPATGECVQCVSDDDCDNGTFCDGQETCLDGACQAGEDPCGSGQTCDEDLGECVSGCVTEEDCDDGNACTADACDDGVCVRLAMQCPEGEMCDAGTGACVPESVLCTSDEGCPDDGEFCNGTESCDLDTGTCVSSGTPCQDGETCDDDADACLAPVCDDLILTEEIDQVVGTDCDEIIIASDQTYNNGDTIDGGDGADRLNLTTTGPETEIADIVNVEQAFIRNMVDGQSIFAGGWEEVQELWYDRGAEDLTLKALTFLPTIGLTGGDGADSDFDVEFAVNVCRGTDDALTVALADANCGDVTLQGANDTDGFENVTFNVSGDNELAAFASAGLTTLTFTGSGSVTIAGALVGAEIIDASAADADVAVTADDVALAFVGGAGSDTVTFAAGEFDESDSVDGGDGDDAVHVVLDASVTVAGAAGVSISNCEFLGARGDDDGNAESFTLDLGEVDALTNLHIDSLGAGATADTLTFDDIAFGPALVFRGDGEDTDQVFDNIRLEFTGVTGDDRQDVEFTNDGQDLDTNSRALTLATLNIDNVEDLFFTVIDGGDLTITTLNPDACESINVASTGSFVITNPVQSTAVSKVDLSGLSGDGTVSVSNSNVDCAMTGGAGNDTLSGGKGVDSLVGGGGDDTLTGDTATVADAVADNLTGGTGSDTFVMLSVAASSANADSISDFTTGASGDVLGLDMSSLESSGAVDADEATNFTELNDGTDIADADAISIHECTGGGGACTPGGRANVLVLITGTFADTDALETALEAGGSTPLAIHADAGDVGSSFPVVYSDGTDGFLAVCFAETETADDTDFESGDLTCVNVAKMEVNAVIAASEFHADNFDYLP